MSFLSFLPLAYFGLTRTAGKQGYVLAGLAFWTGLWLVAASLVRDAATIEAITRYGMAIPASLAAAYAFSFDKALRTQQSLPHRLAAASFVIYAFLQLFLSHGNIAFLSSLNSGAFEATTGISVLLLRTAVAILITALLLNLLAEYDRAMQRDHQAMVTRTRVDLAEREARLAGILNAEPDCVKSVDANCCLLDMNPAGLAMIEADDIGNVRGAFLPDLIDERHRARFEEGVARVFRGENTHQRFEIIGLKGTRRWMEQTAAPLYDPARPDFVREMIAVTRDVTDQVEAERNLERTNTRLEQAQRVAHMGYWDWNIVTNDLEWSNEIYRIFGLAPQQFEASYPAFLERVHPDDRATVEAAVQRAVADGELYSVDHRIVRPDGTERWVHEQGEIEYDWDGTPLRMLGIVQDIDDLHRTATALRQSEASLAGILRLSPEAVVVTDSHGTITMFSTGAELIFGMSAGDTIGQPIEILLPERLHDAHRRHFAGFLASNVESRRMGERSEIAGRRANGEEFPAEASLSRLDTETGTILTVILRDMSAAKAAENALKEARYRAESANEAKSRFIANMSHELRTPLNAIIGFSHLLATDDNKAQTEDKTRQYAGYINESGHHLLSLINDILDMSRIEVGKTELVEEDVDIAKLVETSLTVVRHLIVNGTISMQVDLASDLPAIYADRRLLSQILINLLSKAIKFSPAGGRVELSARIADSGDTVICVRDHGVGMTAKQMEHLGTPFTQVDDSLERRHQGLGLGISIARRLAEMHGGSLSFESEPGEGTAARLILPASRKVEGQNGVRAAG
ncbi:MAG: PAS domain S-box protein [Alphaproteobacteria bacterium]